MPAGIAPRVRAVTIGLLLLAIAIPLVVASAQARFGGGAFEFGHARVFEGRLVEHPYPMLQATGAGSGRYWLVGPGKRGAAAIVSGMDGRSARVTGTLIERDGERMIQVEPDGVHVDLAALPTPTGPPRAAGAITLVGEIVDSKCHLGVMKPGEGPVHRDCAMRCLLGGVPPMLVVRTGGAVRRVPLVAPEGTASTIDLEPWVARPVRIRGVRYQRGVEEYVGVASDRIAVID